MIGFRVRTHSGSVADISDLFRLRGLQEFSLKPHKFPKWLKWMLFGCIAAIPILYEMRTSAVQSWILSSYARKMSYKMGPGSSPNIVFPKHGPFDIRAGYALIPDFEKRLGAAGFRTTEQARFSRELERAARWGVPPPYPERAFTELTIHGMNGQSIFDAPVAGYSFRSFEEIPPLAVRSLLIIENREMSEPADSRTNPVVDWDRLAKAAVLYAGHKLGLPVPVQGGSTLATQLVKYRHSYDGRTDSALAKLRQMTNASLRVYQKGPDTREERRQIILDYLNSVPLAAAPGYGEIHGIGNGLNVWFGLNPQDVRKQLLQPDFDYEKAKALKHILALMCSVKAPTYYLMRNHSALDERVNYFVQILAKAQVIPENFSEQVRSTPITFSAHPPKHDIPTYAEAKAVNGIRSDLLSRLGLPGFYELDRLDLDVESTINPGLQNATAHLFEKLHDPAFVDASGLRGERLLATGDPSKVTYGMMLYEKTPRGNLLRVVTDNLNAPFDINTGMKMQLGSTAKLRTLVNYLDIVAALHAQLSAMNEQKQQQQIDDAPDPLTRWAAETISRNKGIALDAMLQMALDRKYSASPGEVFFTGGGAHAFSNFDKRDNGRIVSVREATERSVNLAFVRLMRDIVKYYEARLPYDTNDVLADRNNSTRRKMLQEIADQESQYFLFQAFKDFDKKTPDEVIAALLGRNAKSARYLAILFYAWNPGADEQSLAQWLQDNTGRTDPAETKRMAKAYGNPRLNLSDYGYLLGIHPLKVWCAGKLVQNPLPGWDQVLKESEEARRISSAWLFKTRNRSAQDLRLRIRFEQDAFAYMASDWKRLGFPFNKLVPSLATAIGSSGDRPAALAQLMGILLNDGRSVPSIQMLRLRFAAGTPYETVMEPVDSRGTQVIPQAVARAVLPVLAQVVQIGSAARLSGALKVGNRMLIVGGKTGSGDNRIDTVARGGQRIASRAIDRTAVFVFYIEDRFFGVITAFVPGKEASGYGFTSSLPVAILKLMSKDIEALWQPDSGAASKELAMAAQATHPAPNPITPGAVSR